MYSGLSSTRPSTILIGMGACAVVDALGLDFTHSGCPKCAGKCIMTFLKKVHNLSPFQRRGEFSLYFLLFAFLRALLSKWRAPISFAAVE
jgi:hypothetical protein